MIAPVVSRCLYCPEPIAEGDEARLILASATKYDALEPTHPLTRLAHPRCAFRYGPGYVRNPRRRR